jgi:hypothetical protein
MAKKKQWIGWVYFKKINEPALTLDIFGNTLIEVYKKKKGMRNYYPNIRKVKIVEI